MPAPCLGVPPASITAARQPQRPRSPGQPGRQRSRFILRTPLSQIVFLSLPRPWPCAQMKEDTIALLYLKLCPCARRRGPQAARAWPGVSFSRSTANRCYGKAKCWGAAQGMGSRGGKCREKQRGRDHPWERGCRRQGLWYGCAPGKTLVERDPKRWEKEPVGRRDRWCSAPAQDGGAGRGRAASLPFLLLPSQVYPDWAGGRHWHASSAW